MRLLFLLLLMVNLAFFAYHRFLDEPADAAAQIAAAEAGLATAQTGVADAQKAYDAAGPEGTRVGFTPDGRYTFVGVREGAYYWVEARRK